MILQHSMIADDILKTTKSLTDRGLPEDSYFKLTFADGSECTEKDTNWSALSEKRTVGYFNHQKVIHVCKYPITRIEAFHEGLHGMIDVPAGCEVYQAIRGDTVIVVNYKRMDRIIGRIIGLLKDGQIVEEQFLNGLQYKVEGMRN